MRGWYIGITRPSQGFKAGSTPVPRSTEIPFLSADKSGFIVLMSQITPAVHKK